MLNMFLYKHKLVVVCTIYQSSVDMFGLELKLKIDFALLLFFQQLCGK